MTVKMETTRTFDGRDGERDGDDKDLTTNVFPLVRSPLFLPLPSFYRKGTDKRGVLSLLVAVYSGVA